MRIDPYNHKERYLAWKEKVKDGIPDISKANSDLILAYLRDMETGMNTALGNVKGPRSFIRLNTLREKLIFFSKKLKDKYALDKMTDITEEQICEFFLPIFFLLFFFVKSFEYKVKPSVNAFH